jgi:hypothetical protein
MGELPEDWRGTGTWCHVAPDYRIEGGHVCPVGNTTATYLPARRHELPAALARVDGDARVIDFVRRYGLLGYGQAYSPEERVGVRHLDVWFGIEGTERQAALRALGSSREAREAPGDPVDWVLAHAATVRLVINLIGTFDDEAALRGVLQTLRVRDEQGVVGYAYQYAERGRREPHLYRMIDLGGSPQEVAGQIVSHVLVANLSGTSRQIVADWGQAENRFQFVSLFSPRNLLDTIYWQLADVAVGGDVRRCADPTCGAWFVATHAKMKYCPPPRGYYQPDDDRDPVSPCMNRHKQRQYAAKRRKR